MNILWISNITFPEALTLQGGDGKHNGGGGWLISAANALIKQPGISLYILSVNNVKKLTRLKGKKIEYFIIPKCKHISDYIPYMTEIQKEVSPDVVHIQGTEFPYGLAWIKACSSKNVVVSIQGLISVIARYYTAGLSVSEIIRNITLRDIVGKTIYGKKKEFDKRGRYEIEVLKSVDHVIGRTNFDYSHSKAMNPHINYHHCDEALRDVFYFGTWTYNDCTPCTIFMSQSNYPVKGLHIVLKALPYIIKNYPNLQLRIAGNDVFTTKSVLGPMSQTGYGKLITALIRKNHLEKYISFTGRLNAEEMKREYLNANVFICPSSIENSPNSLCEAQILGVPTLASYVGGVPDLMEGAEKYMYRYDDSEMMAVKICDIFNAKDAIDASAMQQVAQKRHNRNNIVSQLMHIYGIVKE